MSLFLLINYNKLTFLLFQLLIQEKIKTLNNNNYQNIPLTYKLKYIEKGMLKFIHFILNT